MILLKLLYRPFLFLHVSIKLLRHLIKLFYYIRIFFRQVDFLPDIIVQVVKKRPGAQFIMRFKHPVISLVPQRIRFFWPFQDL